MNALIVGTRKETVLAFLPDTFLLIDDGDLIDAVPPRPRRAVSVFDPAIHSFNPLRGMDHRRARDFAAAVYSTFPQGEGTLTVRNGRRELAKLVLAAPRLDKVTGDRKDPAVAEALAAIDDILFSPIVRQVLCNPPNFPVKGIILARLNRAELGDHDCYILGNLLMSLYKGPIVVPDFGFYSASWHSSLLRQNRLVVGINAFEEAEQLRNQLLLIDHKVGSHCTAEDAKTLALYAGYMPDTDGSSMFIRNCMK